MTHLSLRFRVFLFFCLMVAGAIGIVAGSLALVWGRAEPDLPLAPFVTAFICFALLNTGFLAGIWLLFDENVSKPITRLSADLRMRVHADVDAALAGKDTRYLGDLAPAVTALSVKASLNIEDKASEIAKETARLGAEHSRLAALLTQSPVATILVNPADEIVLYDAQAASILSEITPPRLKAQLSEYFEPSSLAHARTHPCQTSIQLCTLNGLGLTARLKNLGADGQMIFIDPPLTAALPQAEPPLVFDFDLMHIPKSTTISEQPLSSLCYVVLDLETTGLSILKDDIVQMAAVRVVNGTIVAGETFETYVNPGRPIPPASTRIHHVSDAHVVGAPDVIEASQQLHEFARGAVLVAHNAPFDLGFLKRCAKQADVEWAHPVLDTVLLSCAVYGPTEEHSLDALCARLSIEIPPAERHTAMGDAKATALALICLLKTLEARGYSTFGALQKKLNSVA
jgi:DNA polymerase-3 subunit epsilon